MNTPLAILQPSGRVARMIAYAWDESAHPRDGDGKWTEDGLQNERPSHKGPLPKFKRMLPGAAGRLVKQARRLEHIIAELRREDLDAGGAYHREALTVLLSRARELDQLLQRDGSGSFVFDPDQPRLPEGVHGGGRWTAGGGAPADPNAVAEELQRQKHLAAAQANPLAHPPFVIGYPDTLTLSPHDYIAAYGQEFKSQALPNEYRSGIPKECYSNASQLVLGNSGLRYAEGIAYSSAASGLPFMHAWAVDRAGNVIDNTWSDAKDAKYFGVVYDRSAYIKYLYKAKIYGVLGSTEKNARRAIETGGAGLRDVSSVAVLVFDPNQARDARGRWSKMGGSSLLDKGPGGKDTLQENTDKDKKLKAARQKLHDRIFAEELAKATPVTDPTFYLMGGGGAAGKSVMQAHLPSLPKNMLKVDVDVIRTKFPEWDRELKLAAKEGRKPNVMLATYTHEEASMLSKRILVEARNRGYNIMLDGTGDTSPEKITNQVENVYRAKGHRIVANYMVVDYDVAYARMRVRGDKTGRYIPAAYLREIHSEVSRILPVVVHRGTFDELNVWDTTNLKSLGNGKFSAPLLVASGTKKDGVVLHSSQAWAAISQRANGIAPRAGEI